MHQEKVSVEIGKALPQLRKWRIKVWRFKQDVVSFIQRTKGEQSYFQWKHCGIVFTVVLSAVDKLAWKVFQMTCQCETRRVKCHYRNDTRRQNKVNAPRNFHHHNLLAALGAYA